MVLEATIICLDNSEFMRNGDYSPTRFEAQQDACSLICGTKTRANMENVVGLVAAAGKSVEVCVTLTQDLGKILGGLHRLAIGGQSNFLAAIQVASLALRHRQNKRQEQRIIAFIGSPLTASETELKVLGSQLKKNNIALDIISFGDQSTADNQPKLELLMETVNSHDNSHLVVIPPGEAMLSQMLSTTPIIRSGASSESGGAAAGGGDDFEFGIDPNVDPELALAMRLSMQSAEEEQRRRQGDQGGESAPSAALSNSAAAPQESVDAMDEDDSELMAALAMSRQSSGSAPAPADAPDTMDIDDDDEELRMALEMSRHTASMDRARDQGDSQPPESSAPASEGSAGGPDADYMASVLLGLPGVDASDPEIQRLLQSMQQSKPDEKKEDK